VRFEAATEALDVPLRVVPSLDVTNARAVGIPFNAALARFVISHGIA
jgi:hypothetical protein